MGKVFGEIKLNEKMTLRVQTIIWGGSEKYDLRVYNGAFAIKGVTMTPEEFKNLRDSLVEYFAADPVVEATEPEILQEPVIAQEPEKQPEPEQTGGEKTEDERVIHSLTHIPVNDSNYPLNTATTYQLRKAIEYMEANPDGQKTRLSRCKGRLNKLEAMKLRDINAKARLFGKVDLAKADVPSKVIPLHKSAEAAPQKAETQKVEPKKEDVKETAIIKFPKKDETPIEKLPPSDIHYTYEDAKEKLDKERRIFQGDRDSEYVIDGILEACLVDQELLDNVMRPEKSYVGAFQYFANKAREGHCIIVGNTHFMDTDTALKYAIDYFNSVDKKPKATRKTKKTEKPATASVKSGGDVDDTEEEGRTDEEVYDEEGSGTD